MKLDQLERITKVPRRRIIRYSRLGFIGEQRGGTIKLSEADIYPLKIIHLLELTKQSTRRVIEVIEAKNQGNTRALQHILAHLTEQAELNTKDALANAPCHYSQLADELRAFIRSP